MSSSDLSEIFENQLIENRFVVGQSIGKGSFGEVYDGRDNVSGVRVAIKFESHNSTHKQLENEYKVSVLELESIDFELECLLTENSQFSTHRFIASYVAAMGFPMSTAMDRSKIMII